MLLSFTHTLIPQNNDMSKKTTKYNFEIPISSTLGSCPMTAVKSPKNKEQLIWTSFSFSSPIKKSNVFSTIDFCKLDLICAYRLLNFKYTLL